jgi:hypothetical protein
MRTSTALVILGLTLVAHDARAQIMQQPAPPPAVTAANAGWYQRGEPIFYAGAYYYQTGPNVFFDGKVMSRSGAYEGIPLYEDSTIVPFSVVYVPIGGKMMRPYERRRDGDLAGTTASRAPSFPVQHPSEAYRMMVASQSAPIGEFASEAAPELPTPVSPIGSTLPAPVSTASTSSPAPVPTIARSAASAPRNPAKIESWVLYQGIRWYSSGQARSFESGRFVQIGSYDGQPVYRAGSDESAIYVPLVEGGFLTPFTRK